MANNFDGSIVQKLVAQMHEKFDLGYDGPPRHLDTEEEAFRSMAMQEELYEYKAATTLVDKYDALLDLIVFAAGTLHRHGFPLDEGFSVVMGKNMQKKLGQNGNKRGGFKRDLVKPDGWTPPEDELQAILRGRVIRGSDG